MFSWASLIRLRRSLHRAASIQRLNSTRTLFIQSQRPTSSSTSTSINGGLRYGDHKGHDFDSFLRSISSGVVVVGSTLGFWYWSSLSSSSGDNSLHSFADYATEDDQFHQQYGPQKKSSFLFNGNTRFSF